MANYIPTTPDELKEMLEACGVSKVEELFSEIPPELRQQKSIDIPAGLSESEMLKKMDELASKNKTVSQNISFLGGGAYDHIIPAVIDHLLLRGDFFTAYTPYQAEVSQGTLQAIYEFQSLICSLTGMDQANASMYEGASALAEAINMAVAQTRRQKVIVLSSVNPSYRNVIKSINGALGVQIELLDFEECVTSADSLEAKFGDDTAAVVMQYPNFFGGVEDIEKFSEIAHAHKALSIVSTNPIALGMLEAPGNLGADIVTGEGQPLGVPLSFGGPWVGFLGAKKKLLRRMPGRISGKTKDVDGKVGFVLTLQAREQHIRREKASSNICSNQALVALNATIYLSLLGRDGLKEVADQSFQKAHFMKRELEKIDGIDFPFNYSFFNEFIVKIPDAKKLVAKMTKNGIFAGILLENQYPQLKDCLLIAVTEKRTREEIEAYCKMIGGFLNG